MIQVDISNVWGRISLRDLLGIEAEVAEVFQTLTECPGLQRSIPAEELLHILATAEKIRSGCDVCVVVGPEEFCRGSRALIELLQGEDRNLNRGKGDPQIFFAGSDLSTRRWNELMGLLSGKDVVLIAVSSAEASLESGIALRGLRWMLERKYGTDEANGRIYAVTDPKEGALAQLAREKGWPMLPLPGNVGARFSLLTAAGLLPMSVAGIDIQSILKGAAQAREEYALGSFENPVWLYAALRTLLYREGMTVELLSAFEPSLRAFGSWWQQMMGSAEGKGLLPVCAQWPADFSALGSAVRQGAGNILETLLHFDGPEQELTIIGDIHDLDGLNYLEGKSLDDVQQQAFQCVVSHHADAGAPVIVIECGARKEATAGELIWFMQLSACLSACMLGGNFFDNSGECRQALETALGKQAEEDLCKNLF